MAKHVYLSKRVALGIHLAKMNPARRQKYNENRRERQSKSRQAIFINEYFYIKYNELYKEAALFYNQVNAHYPHKHDLRKCEAFKNWKTAQQTNTNSCEKTVTKKTDRRYHKVSYPDISVEQSKSRSQKAQSEIQTTLHQQKVLTVQNVLEYRYIQSLHKRPCGWKYL